MAHRRTSVDLSFLGLLAPWLVCATAPLLAAPTCETPTDDPDAIAEFVRAECYAAWAHQPQHLSGTEVDGTFFTVHGDIEVFYSPGVGRWLDGESGSIPDGEMVVALERPHGKAQASPSRALVKVRAQGFSVDGWYWSSVPLTGRGRATGRFADSTCLSCHASARSSSTFLDAGGPVDTASWRPDPAFVFPDPPPVTRRLPRPLAKPDPAFLTTYGVPADLPEPRPYPSPATDRVVARGTNQFMTSDQCAGCHNAGQRLSNTRPNLWYPDPNGEDPTYRNYSPFGEWSASIHSLATRDPIWHAEVEAEVEANPQLADYIYDTCFSCHGPMAGRQLQTDTGDPQARFNASMFWADEAGEPGATYGALARDGISCTVCHRVTDALLGVDLPPATAGDHVVAGDPPFDGHLGYGVFRRPASPAPYSGNFEIDTSGALFGPYDSVNGTPMTRATGFTPTGGEVAAQISEAKLCGSCHLIIVPSIPKGYSGSDPANDPDLQLVYEQTTYWEWRNSFWENESKSSGLACQGCHMAPHRGDDGRLLSRRIANIESDRFPPVQARLPDSQIHLRQQFPYPRHVFLGINLFALEMFQQFPDMLGSRRPDPTVPKETLDPLLNASDWETQHAARDSVLTNVLRLEERDDALELDVQITNYAGHKFPTGAGIRRAFVELTVLDDDGKVLWSSGTTNGLGVIVDGASGRELASEWTDDPAASQPHHQLIREQDQVQIYEERTLDAAGKLQSSVLGIAGEHKDNRIVPAGWVTEARAGGGTFQQDRRFPNPGSINMFAIHPRLPLATPVAPPKSTFRGLPVPDYCADPQGGQGYDPYYCDPEFTQYGADIVSYRMPKEAVQGWACVQARVLYQSIPPYYLKQRLDGSDGELGPAAQRLAYIASRLNFDDSAIDDWTLQVGNLSSMDRHGRVEADPTLRRCTTGGEAPGVATQREGQP